jgi:carboxylate-amine ligase
MAEIGICDDPTKIWWDIRPSVKHPTLEMRVCDLCTRLEDAMTIAAIYQSLLSYLYRLRSQNQIWRRYRHVFLQENKWRAQRFGVGGTLADYGRRQLVPFAELMDELIDLLKDDAGELGCLAELERAREIVQDGSSSDHQIKVYQAALAAGAEPAEARRKVIDWLIDASMDGVPA